MERQIRLPARTARVLPNIAFTGGTARAWPVLPGLRSVPVSAKTGRPSRRRRTGLVFEETRHAQFRPLPCATILNENANKALDFYWTINPYRGCEFGCSYCYARYTHGFLDHADPASFETKIYVKFQAAQALAETTKPGALRGRPVAMGTATDPYQPAEKRFRITRRLLEVMVGSPDLDLSITTKSPLVVRDIDLLAKIARTAKVRINFSLITMNPDLSRIVDRHAPSPNRRIEAMRALHDAGIHTGLFVMPILPGITDSDAEMRALLREARSAGAEWASGDVVRLMGVAWDSFEPILRAHFPQLHSLYLSLRRSGGRFPGSILEPIRERFRAVRKEVGLSARASDDQGNQTESGWLFAPEAGVAQGPSGVRRT